MKFGDSLEQNMVSEWRSQYLDYSRGKKKLKQLKKITKGTKQKNSNNNDHNNNNNSVNHDHDHYSSISLNSGSKIISNSPNSVEDNLFNKFKNSNINNNKNQYPLHETGSLYSLDDNDNNSLDFEVRPLTSHIILQNKFDENTPLLDDSAVAENERQISGRFDYYNDSSRKRSQSTSCLYRPKLRMCCNTKIDDLTELAKNQFIDWVDEELMKVEMFYKEREDAYIERFLVLQDQLFQLEDQKIKSKNHWNKLKDNNNHHQNGDYNMIDFQNIFEEFDLETHLYDDDNHSHHNHHDQEVENHHYHDRDQWRRYHALVLSARKNIRFLSFLSSRILQIFNKFDMPSLPKFYWLKEDGKAEKQYYEADYYLDDTNDDSNTNIIPSNVIASNINNRREYTRKKKENEKKPEVPYFIARKMLKKAIFELYRSLELLKSYRLMNRTAFRKLIKKYDKTIHETMLAIYMKKVDSLYFTKSEVLETMINNVEDIFTKYFENGNRKIAVTKLRSVDAEKTYYTANFMAGIFIGLSLPIFVFTIYIAISRTLNGDLPEGKYLLQIWSGFFLFILAALLFAVNCYVWDKYKINYKLVFEFDHRDALNYKQYLLLPAVFLFVGSVTSWLTFEDFWTVQFNGREFPWIFLFIVFFLLFNPFDIFYLSARAWFMSSLVRLVLSGFYPVEFRDFFMGVICCSLTYSISNMSMFFCLYDTHWDNCLDGSNNSVCGSSRSRTLGFLQCLPSIWRSLQCLRRFADTGDWFPHFANMAKYAVTTLYFMSLSLYRIETIPKYRALLIFFGTINSIYSSMWDILMDWSLFQLQSENFLLRDVLIYKKKKLYYAAMILDILLRFQWIFFALFPQQIQQSAITSFGISLAELTRRFIWLFFRMENEHATNVHLFRVSRECPLPFPTIKRKKIFISKPSVQNFGAIESIPELCVHSDSCATGNLSLKTTISNNTDAMSMKSAKTTKSGYLYNLSNIISNAHVKEFQRRKVDKKLKNGVDASDLDEGENDTEEDIEEEEEEEEEEEGDEEGQNAKGEDELENLNDNNNTVENNRSEEIFMEASQ